MYSVYNVFLKFYLSYVRNSCFYQTWKNWSNRLIFQKQLWGNFSERQFFRGQGDLFFLLYFVKWYMLASNSESFRKCLRQLFFRRNDPNKHVNKHCSCLTYGSCFGRKQLHALGETVIFKGNYISDWICPFQSSNGDWGLVFNFHLIRNKSPS